MATCTQQELETGLEDVKRQLQDKSLELEKEIALRKLLNSQKDEQAKKLRAAEQQIQHLTSVNKADSDETRAVGKEPLLNLLREAEERSKDLTAKLHDRESELQSLKLSHLRQETANSAKVAAQSAALMQRLSSMQREREKVLMTQLRAALKERQEALARAGALEDKDVVEKAKNTELEQVFEEMRAAKDASELQQKGAILVSKVKALREAYDGSVRDKLQFLKSERDAAETRAQSLAVDVAQLQRRLEMTETEYKLVDKTRIKVLQAQLEATVKERDEYELRVLKLEDAMETLRIVNSLQKSLGLEEERKRSYELKLRRHEAEKTALEHKLEEMMADQNVAILERNCAVQERNVLAVQAQQEFDRAEKFQRVANVLRKKARNA